ncbi:hypothetical protein ACFSTC_62045 [Nonomuraea ferruginea]
MQTRARILIPLLAAGLAAAACTGGGGTAAPTPATSQAGSPPAQGNADALPRNETLYTTGTQWGPLSQLQPDPRVGLRHRDQGPGVRDALPLRPERGQTRPPGSPRAAAGRTTRRTRPRSARASPGPTASR